MHWLVKHFVAQDSNSTVPVLWAINLFTLSLWFVSTLNRTFLWFIFWRTKSNTLIINEKLINSQVWSNAFKGILMRFNREGSALEWRGRLRTLKMCHRWEFENASISCWWIISKDVIFRQHNLSHLQVVLDMINIKPSRPPNCIFMSSWCNQLVTWVVRCKRLRLPPAWRAPVLPPEKTFQRWPKTAPPIGVFDISISHIDYRYIDTFWKYRYRYRYP